MVLPAILSATRTAISFSASAAKATVGSLSTISRGVGALGDASSSLFDRTKQLGEGIFFAKQTYESLLGVASQAYNLLIKQNEDLNKSLLKSQTILAQSVNLYDQQGNKVESVRDKIMSFGDALREQRKVLEQDTKEIPGVTSAFTISVFDQVLQRYGQLQGQTREYGSDLEGLTQLSGNLTAALSNLNLTDQTQLVQEVRALLSGDVNNPDSTLSQTLGISKEEFNQLRASGQLVDGLNAKLKPFREGAALGAMSIGNEIENINDAIQIFTRSIGEELSQPVAEALNKARKALESVLTNQDLINKSKQFFNTILETALNFGEGLGKVVDIVNNIGLTRAVGDLFMMSADTLNNIVIAVNSGIDGLVNTTTSFVNIMTNAGQAIKKALDFLNPFDGNKESKVILEIDSPSLSALEKFVDRFNGGVRTIIDRIAENSALRFLFPEGLNEQFEKATTEILRINEKVNTELSANNTNLLTQATQNAESAQKAFNELEEKGVNSLIRSLQDTSELGTTLGSNKDERLETLSNYEAEIKRLNLDNEASILDSINRLKDAESNATTENAKERSDLARLVEFQVSSGIKNTTELGNKFSDAIVKTQEEIKRLQAQEGSIVGVEAKEKVRSDIQARQKELKELIKVQKEAGLSANFLNTSLVNLPKTSRTEKLTQDLDNGLRNLQEATNSAQISEAAGQLVKTIPNAVKEGTLSIEDARTLLSQLASDNRLNVQEQIQFQEQLTTVIQTQSQIRQSVLEAEKAVLQARLDIGTISQNDFNIQNQVLAIGKAKDDLNDLETKLNSLLVATEGVETSDVVQLREEIRQQTALVFSEESNLLKVNYEAVISDLQAESDRLSDLAKFAEQRIIAVKALNEQNMSSEAAQLEADISQRQILAQEIVDAKRQYLEVLNSPTPADNQGQLEKQKELRTRLLDIVTKQNELGKTDIEIQKAQNDLILSEVQARNTTSKLLEDKRNKLLILSGDINDEQVQSNELTQKELSIVSEIEALRKAVPSTLDEQKSIADQILQKENELLDVQVERVKKAQDLAKAQNESIQENSLSLMSRYIELENQALNLANSRLDKELQILEAKKSAAQTTIQSETAKLAELEKAKEEEAAKGSIFATKEELAIGNEINKVKNNISKAEREQAQAERKSKAKEAEKKANEKQIGLTSIDSQAQKQVFDLQKKLDDINKQEKKLFDSKALTEEQAKNFDTQRRQIKQELVLVNKEKGLGFDKLVEEGTISKSEAENLKKTEKERLKNLNPEDLKPNFEEGSVDDSMTISNASISIDSANISGLEGGKNSGDLENKAGTKSYKEALDLSQSKAVEILTDPNLSVSKIKDIGKTNANVSEAINKIDKPVQKGDVKQDGQASQNQVNNTKTENNTENVTILNQWSSLSDVRALARTKGI